MLQRIFNRSTLALALDLAMAALSVVATLYLRLGSDLEGHPPSFLLAPTALFMAAALVAFLALRSHRTNWRFVSIEDVVTLFWATLLANALFLLLMFLVYRAEALPRSFPFINGFVLMALLGAPRLAYRMLREGRLVPSRTRAQGSRIPVLLVGGGEGTDLFLRAVANRAKADYLPVGILDAKRDRHGTRIRGVPVLGEPERLGPIIDRLARQGVRPQKLVVTDRHLPAARLREILDLATRHGLSLARLPHPTELKSGPEAEASLRPVAIEDLLGRPQTVLDRGPMQALIKGKRVLVTGAGGTIGGELSRQVAAFGPTRLILVDASELNLYTIDLEIGRRWPELDRRAVLCDVRRQSHLAKLIAEERPALVLHAAALKHVPLVEAHPIEGAWTNAVGTRNLADACVAHGVEAMVLISTDKAVNPASVMGATKRLAESYCQGLDLIERRKPRGTRFVSVRFGNVLGSSGSVVPLFQQQLLAGGPLTVTHPDMTRYFMTVSEAVELVLQATAAEIDASIAAGKIFVLDMGEPIRIADLARQMIRLAGLRPDIDVKIETIGLRPGERLHEELFHEAEPPVPTRLKGVLLASPRAADRSLLVRAMEDLEAACRSANAERVLAVLHHFVPDYRAAETGGPHPTPMTPPGS